MKREYFQNSSNEYKSLEQSYGVEVHWFNGGDFEVPDRYDLSSIPADLQEGFTRKLEILKKYVLMPAIVDRFENHSQRRTWYGNLARKDKDAYDLSQNNRLRAAKWVTSVEALKLLEIKYLEHDKKRQAELKKINEQLQKELPVGDGNTPLKFVDKVTEAALEVLNIYIKPPLVK